MNCVSTAKLLLKDGKSNEAAELLKEAANTDNVASFMLAMLYHSGKCTGGDGMEYMKMSAQMGNKNAQFLYSEWYETENGTLTVECLDFLEKSANSGHVGAARKLALFNLRKRNYDGFVEWLKIAAGFNGTIENYFVVLEFTGNEIFEVMKVSDSDKLKDLLIIFVELLDEGKITISSDDSIIDFYQTQEQNGLVEATYGLGIMSLRNMLPESSPKLAFQYFSKAVENGLILAHSRLGQCYAFGVGVKPSMKQALLEFEKGAQSGNCRSLYAHGHFLSMLSKGQGADSLIKSAEAGYPDAAVECYKLIKQGAMKDPYESDGAKLLEIATRLKIQSKCT